MTAATNEASEANGSHRITRERVHLRPRVTAPRVARQLVRTACAEAGLSRPLSDDAAMVAGELVTASIRQAHCDIDVVVEADCRHVRIGVRDAWPNAPLLGLDLSTGPERSTAVVERLASSWGYCHSEDGRELWALLRLTRVR